MRALQLQPFAHLRRQDPPVIGIGEEMSVLVLDPTYRTAVGFVAILLVLSLRPRGLLGERAY